ncbi:RNA polymerase sigma-70 factor (sigma-E family) [Kribbella amoyensis]|uniref:RNA polymerase sigma-70 factor (Sigma-E family) n=1 Tax=Kribbella amoyensis TaxID=996641 RepID=A0A561BSB7_9ACTN|nr:SigE family RNA polymerase sigma factor [Kribbella amoyensis]TWD81775.1 RNA polymerase sigma-70 factor (sigma-E family) [Kribbella amoyensis]
MSAQTVAHLAGVGIRPATVTVDFTDYVTLRYRQLLGTAYLLTRDRGLAEDLVQTTLAKAWRSWHRIEADDPDAYVRRVLVNTFRAGWRVKRGKREFTAEVVPERPVTGEYEASDRRAALLAALARLPRRMRAMVVLRYFEDLTEAATADALGCSVGTVKSQTSRALAKLRQDPTLTGLWDFGSDDTGALL